MTDFDKVLTPGDIKNGLVNVVIEMPAGSIDKIEWHRQVSGFRIDRTNLSTFQVPVNYGFIPRTLNEDDDELDVLVISGPIQTEVSLVAKVIGVMKFKDEGDSDDKIVAVPLNDISSKMINSLEDLSKSQTEKIEHYFSHYKDYISPGCTKVLGWGDIEEAKQVVDKSVWLWGEQL
jgi:inorganic pyrophosphatase